MKCGSVGKSTISKIQTANGVRLGVVRGVRLRGRICKEIMNGIWAKERSFGLWKEFWSLSLGRGTDVNHPVVEGQ